MNVMSYHNVNPKVTSSGNCIELKLAATRQLRGFRRRTVCLMPWQKSVQDSRIIHTLTKIMRALVNSQIKLSHLKLNLPASLFDKPVWYVKNTNKFDRSEYNCMAVGNFMSDCPLKGTWTR